VKPPGMDSPACLENKTPELSRKRIAPAIAPYLHPVDTIRAAGVVYIAAGRTQLSIGGGCGTRCAQTVLA